MYYYIIFIFIYYYLKKDIHVLTLTCEIINTRSMEALLVLTNVACVKHVSALQVYSNINIRIVNLLNKSGNFLNMICTVWSRLHIHVIELYSFSRFLI